MSHFPLKQVITDPNALKSLRQDDWEHLFTMVRRVPAALSIHLMFAPDALPVLPTEIDFYITNLPQSQNSGLKILHVALLKRRVMLAKIVAGKFDKTLANIHTMYLLEQMIERASVLKEQIVQVALMSHTSMLKKAIEANPSSAFPIRMLPVNVDVIPEASWRLLLDDVRKNPKKNPLLLMFTQTTLPQTKTECEFYTNILYPFLKSKYIGPALLKSLEIRRRDIQTFVGRLSERSACEDREVERRLRTMEVHLSILDFDSHTKTVEQKAIADRLKACELDGDMTDFASPLSDDEEQKEELKEKEQNVFPLLKIKTAAQIQAIDENVIRKLIADARGKDDSAILELMFTKETKPITELECTIYKSMIAHVDATAMNIINVLELLESFYKLTQKRSMKCNEEYDRTYLLQIRERLVALDSAESTATEISEIDAVLRECRFPRQQHRPESKQAAEEESKSSNSPDVPEPDHELSEDEIVIQKKKVGRNKQPVLEEESDQDSLSEDEAPQRGQKQTKKSKKKVVRKKQPALEEESDQDSLSEDESPQRGRGNANPPRLRGNTHHAVNDVDTSKPLVPITRMKKFLDDYIRAMGGHAGQKKFPVSAEFLKNVNLRLYEWVRDVMSLLQYTQQPSDSSSEEQKCGSLVIGRTALKEALELTNPKLKLLSGEHTFDLHQEFDVQVPEPTKKHLTNAMLFYAHPLRRLTEDAYKVMKIAFSERLVYLARTVWDIADNTRNKKFSVCPSRTTLGKVPHNKVEEVNFHGS